MIPCVSYFTLATAPDRGFAQYLVSCDRNNIRPNILGLGQEWGGFTQKLRLLREAIEPLSAMHTIVVSDCYDVVFQKSPAQLYYAYNAYNKPIVFSSEPDKGWPNLNTILPETPNPRYRSLCAGFWMGRCGAVKRMLDQAYPNGFDDKLDDQNALQRWFAEHHDDAVVDYRNELVTTAYTHYAKTDLEYGDRIVRNKHTGTAPCALHVPKADMTRIYRTLDLPDEYRLVWGSRTHQLYQESVLAAYHPWPATKPDVQPDGEAFFGTGNRRLFDKLLSKPMGIILELGSWVGMGSTRFFLENSNATIICNDTWKDDSEELVAKRPDKIATLFETFCHNNWAYRHRIIPVRLDTLEGLRAVAANAIIPDLIYVDANHRYADVTAQLELIHSLYPHSIITGDDWDIWPEVQQAVSDFASNRDIDIIFDGNAWMFEEDSWARSRR